MKEQINREFLIKLLSIWYGGDEDEAYEILSYQIAPKPYNTAMLLTKTNIKQSHKSLEIVYISIKNLEATKEAIVDIESFENTEELEDTDDIEELEDIDKKKDYIKTMVSLVDDYMFNSEEESFVCGLAEKIFNAVVTRLYYKWES